MSLTCHYDSRSRARELAGMGRLVAEIGVGVRGPHHDRVLNGWVIAVAVVCTIAFLGLWFVGHLLGWNWPDAADWQAIWTFATFLVAVLAVVVAVGQLDAHRETQWEQSRPYVIVDFAFRSTVLMIEVKNIGQSAARDVRLSWSPTLIAKDVHAVEAIQRNLVHGVIPYLAPGRAIRYYMGTIPEHLNDDSLPKRFEVTASYTDSAGRGIDGEVMLLDLGQWEETLADSDYENKNWNERKRQTAAIKEVTKSIQALARDLRSKRHE